MRLIVPTSPGGVTDTMARIVAQRLTETLGQTVIVDNRAGGNGSVGAIAVAHAPPDGLTLLVTSDATITANPSLSSKLGYSAKDFTPIIVLCRGTPMLVVNATVPANSVKELIALAKAKPGTLNYGSYGVGTYAHLSMEDFKQRTGTDIVHIPYRGATPAAQALLAGDVSMLLLNLQQHRGAREDRQGENPRRGRRQARAGAAGPADHRRGRRAGLLDHGVVRAVRPGQHAAGAGAEDLRRRQQGARPAADRRSSSRRTASSGSRTRPPSSPSWSSTIRQHGTR